MVRQSPQAAKPAATTSLTTRNKPLFAELLEPRETPSVSGLEDVYSLPPVSSSPASQPLIRQARARFVVGTDGGGTAQINVYDAQTNALLGTINPFGRDYKGGMSVATGDITGDGIEDIVVASGRGGQPVVKVFDGANLTERVSFLAYSQTFFGGVSVAVGDVNGDGRGDVVVGAGVGSAPHIKVYSGTELFAQPGSAGNTNPRAFRNFFAFDASNRAGVSVAAADLDGDHRAEIIVGTGAGVAGQIRAFSGLTGAKVQDFTVGGPSNKSGVNVAAADITGDGIAEIVAGQATGGTLVRIYHNSTEIASFAAFPTGKGVRVATEDVNGDGKAEVIVSVSSGAPKVRVLNGLTGDVLRDFPGFVPSYNVGLVVG